MRNIRLCGNDEEEIVSSMKNLRETLEGVGIEGTACVIISSNGDMRGVFHINSENSFAVDIEDDDRKKVVTYSCLN